MAEFKRKAREGSFAANELAVPDEVRKLENQANRRIQGMNTAQAELEKSRSLFLQAQRLSQNLSNQGRRTAADITSRNLSTEKSNIQKEYEAELNANQVRAKEKANTLKLLSGLSKTAFNLTNAIIQKNRDDHLKAINQIAFKQGFSFQDIVNAKSIDTSITQAEWSRTNVVQDYIKEGKSPEFINAVYEHLVKGGGYRNYVNNVDVLRRTAADNASKITLVANNKNLSIDERRKEINRLDAVMRGDLTVDGQIPSKEILEQAYNPEIRSALKAANRVLNEDTLQALEETTRIDRNIILQNAMYPGGESFNPEAGFALIANDPRPGALTDFTRTWVAGGDRSLDEIAAFRAAQFQKDGKMVTIMQAGTPETLNLLDQEEQRAKQMLNEQRGLEAQALKAEVEVFMMERAQALIADGRYTEQEHIKLTMQADEQFGILRDKTIDEALKGYTVKAQLYPVIIQQLEEMRLDKSLSIKKLDDMLLPKDIYEQYQGPARQLDNIRNSTPYKDLDQRLERIIKSAMRSNKNIQITLDGKLQNIGAQIYMQNKIAEYKKKYLDLAPTSSKEELDNLILQAGADTLKEVEGNQVGEDLFKEEITSLRANDTSNQLEARLAKYAAYRLQGKNDPKDVIGIIGENIVANASAEFQRSGNSALISTLAKDYQLTPVELINTFAEVSNKIDKVEVPQTYQDMLESWTPPQRFSFTSDLVTRQQRQRDIRKFMGNTDPLPVRPSFDQSEGARSFTGALTYSGNVEAYRAAGQAFADAGFRVGEHSDFDPVDPVHTADSYHYHDEAFDITHQTGEYNESIAKTGRLQQLIEQLDLFDEIIGPLSNDPDHATHLHLGGLKRPLTPDDIQAIKSLQ